MTGAKGDTFDPPQILLSGRDDSGCIQDNNSFEFGSVLLGYTRIIVAFDGRVERVTCAKVGCARDRPASHGQNQANLIGSDAI